MNTKQFEKIIDENKKLQKILFYISPELYTHVLDSRGCLVDDNLKAACILHDNNGPFKNRINGTVKDEWLSRKNFSNIAKNMVIVLANIPNREDYQDK